MSYTVGEMAQRLQVAPSTLRYYDQEGLLPFVERSEGGNRVFQDVDYEMLRLIGCLKASGMSIKDIREFIHMVLEGDNSIDRRLQLFQKRKAEVERQIAQLQETLDTVCFKCWYYETAKAAGTTAVPDAMTEEELPPQFRRVREKLKK